MRTIIIGLAAMLAIAACDDGGSTAGTTSDTSPATSPTDTVSTTTAPDTFAVSDTTPAGETTPPFDTGSPTDTTAPADTTPPADTIVPADTTPAVDTTIPLPDCALTAETCPSAGAGSTGVTLTLKDAQTDAPTLVGLVGDSDEPSGVYEVVSVDIYQKGAFTSLVSNVGLTDNGTTNGTANFVEGAWAVHLELDLAISLTAPVVGAINETAAETVDAGGCVEFSGNLLLSDLGTCGDGFPEGVDAPKSAEFSYDDGTGTLELKLTLTQAFITSLLPAEYQGLAGFAISGPLHLIITATAVTE